MGRRSAFRGICIAGELLRKCQPAWRGARRLVAAAAVTLLALQSAPAFAQANIHNGGVTLNTAQNGSTTASGTLANRGSDTAAGTLPYNSARFQFDYAVTGGTWNGGIQYQTHGGKPVIWVQPQNVALNAGRNASYAIRMTRGVYDLTFRIGGIDVEDVVRLQFLYQGTLRTLSTAYVTATAPSGTNTLTVSLASTTQIQVVSNNASNSTDVSLNNVTFTVPANVLVDEVRVISGKNNGLTSNSTIGFFDFNWRGQPIVAANDAVSGVNGFAGQANVLNVLANDTLDNPNTAGTDAAALSTVTLSQVSTSNAGVTLNPATGQISVAAGTPAGTHTVTYQICETNTAPANCATATATVTIAAYANLVTVKSLFSADATPNVGDVVTFRITVTNNGSATATSVSLTDLIPAALAATAGNGAVSAGTYNATSGLWSIPSLANGASATLTIEGTVRSGQGGNTITNTLAAPATSSVPDPTTAGDDLTESVAAVAISPAADSGNAIAGVASTPVANVRANDTINGAPATTANSTIAVSGTWAAGITLNTSTGAIAVGSGVAAGTYVLTYRLCDLLTPANCATATATVTVAAPQVDLSIAKTNGVTTVSRGTTVTYTLTVTSSGPDPVTGALVRDTPGAGLTCAASAPVTITGSGVPAGSYTFANLAGAGIALGQLTTGQSTILSYSCQVN